jgi:hypothetical protein
MLKIQRIANGGIVLAVIGQLQADHVDELSALVAQEPPDRKLTLDLKDMVLVDRRAVGFLRECEARGTALRNCPGYVRVWIESGKEDPG